jgi:outer membrane protein assembly factor BamB
MKIRRIGLILLFALLAVTLTACSRAGQSNSWSGVLVTEDYVYYAGGSQVTALVAESGNVAWQYPEKGSPQRLFYAEPVLIGEQLIVVDYAHQLTCLNAKTGAETWKFTQAEGRYIDSPLVVNNLILAPNTDYSLYALDLSGNLVWEFKAGHALWARPATDGPTVYFPSMDKYLYALDATTGALKWKVALDTTTISRPLLENGVLYLGNLDGTFFAFNAEDGTRIWQQKVGGGVWSQPVLHEGKLYFGDQSGRINILNSENGKSVQQIETDAAIVGTGALLDEGLVFGNEDGQVILIGFNGERLWTRSFDGSIYASPERLGNRLVISLNKSEKPLIALDTNGNENWYYGKKK